MPALAKVLQGPEKTFFVIPKPAVYVKIEGKLPITMEIQKSQLTTGQHRDLVLAMLSTHLAGSVRANVCCSKPEDRDLATLLLNDLEKVAKSQNSGMPELTMTVERPPESTPEVTL